MVIIIDNILTINRLNKSILIENNKLFNKSKSKPYAKLFGINNYAVVEHSRAVSIIPNNMVQ